MWVNFLFDPNFPSDIVEKKQFRIDIDPNENIDNLKVIISLKYTDLDPLSYDLYLNERRLETNKRIIEFGITETDVLIIKAIGPDCCLLI